MKSGKAWLALAAALYLFFLAWLVPAGLVWAWWAARPGSTGARLALVDLHGPWSGGNCALVKVGPLQFTDLTWRFRPLGLLRGHLDFALAAALPDSGRVATTLSLGRRDLQLRDLQLRGPAAPFGRALLPGFTLTGTLEARDLQVQLTGGRPVAAAGQVTWRGAGVELAAPLALGDFALQLQNSPAGINAGIKDTGGPLRVDLQARLKTDGAYELNGELAPRGPLQPELAALLALLGQPGPDGRLRPNRSGQLAPLY